jgi:hypothetical protein
MQLPHFEGALRLRSPDGRGLCFHRAVGLVLDAPRTELVIGTIRAATIQEQIERPGSSPVDFIHAWVELAGAVIAPTTYEAMGMKLVPFQQDHYYGINGVKDTHRMSRSRVRYLARVRGLDRLLRHHEPLREGVSFARTILDDAGVPFHDIDGAILPGARP